MTECLDPFAGAAILTIDDDSLQRHLTRSILDKNGFKVAEAPDGEEGLRAVRKQRPEVVLLDIEMPGMDGFEVCRQIRSDPDICETPIIIVTGREDTGAIAKGFEAGATDFLAKPVNWELLPHRIRYVLRTYRLDCDLRLAKKQAEQASAAKTALFATLGHELRTPLNAIIGFSDLIGEKSLGTADLSQYDAYVRQINDSGRQLLDAVNDILEIVKCGSGGQELQEEDIKVSDLGKALAAQISQAAEESGLEVRLALPDDDPVLRIDRGRLRRALFHIAHNAVKFSEDGGTVRIGFDCAAETGLLVEIADQGIGISAEDLPRVMEPFEQVDGGLSRRYEGLGLGIPFAREIFSAHGGGLRFESEPGRGTTVRASLPAARVVGRGGAHAVARSDVA